MSNSLKDLVPRIADDPPAAGRLVDAPEFDLTQVAKKLALTIPVFAAAEPVKSFETVRLKI